MKRRLHAHSSDGKYNSGKHVVYLYIYRIVCGTTMQPAQHYGEAQSLSDGASDHQRRSTQTHKTAATTDDIEHMIATVNGI